MKKIYQIIMLCAMSFALVGCGENVENCEETYKKAIVDNDFETAHKAVNGLYKNFQRVWEDEVPSMDYDNDNRSRVENAASSYSTALENVMCAEARYLFSTGEYADRLRYLVSEIPVIGEKMPVATGYFPSGRKHLQVDVAKFNCYRLYVKCNNSLCDVILDLAIDNSDKQTAAWILTRYKSNCRVGHSIFDGDYMDYADYDKSTAQKKFDEAVANGIFEQDDI